MKTKEKRNHRVTIRLTDSEIKELDRTLKVLGCRSSDALRMGIQSVNIAANELASAQ